jgi:hypothetical protein
MPKAYSCDLTRACDRGSADRRLAPRGGRTLRGERGVGWLQRWSQERSAAPKPRGGSVSPLEEFAAEILKLVAEQPDLTLVETVAKLDKRRIKTSRSSLSRFCNRHHCILNTLGRISAGVASAAPAASLTGSQG